MRWLNRIRRAPVTPIAALLALAAIPGVTLALDADAPKELDLSGDWQREPTLSDDPHAVVMAARAKFTRRRGPERIVIPLDSSGRPPADPEGDRDAIRDRERLAFELRWRRFERLLMSPGRLALRQSPSGLTVKSEDGTDEFEAGGGRTVVSLGGDAGEREAGWHHREFRVVTRGSDGTTQERAYGLDSAGHLTVVTRLSGGGGPKFTVRSVYVPATGASTAEDTSRVPAT
jgi:hypothetical protein